MSKRRVLYSFLGGFCCVLFSLQSLAVQLPGFTKDSCTSTGNVGLTGIDKTTFTNKVGYIYVKKVTTPSEPCPATSTTNTAYNAGFDGFKTTDLLAMLGICSSTGSRGNAILCFYDNPGSDPKNLVISYSFTYDTTVPAVIGASDAKVVSSDGQVQLTFSDSARANAANFVVCYGQVTRDALVADADCSINTRQQFAVGDYVIISGLTNDVEYQLKFASINASSPPSQGPWSDPIVIKASKDLSPLESYDGAGSNLSFNCNATSQTPFAFGIFVVLGIFLFGLGRGKRFSKQSGIFSIVLACFIISPDASARIGQLNFGVNFSPYFPNIDSEIKADGTAIQPIYQNFFGKPGSEAGPWLPRLGPEFHFHVFDGFGSVQVGFGLDYAVASGNAKSASDPSVNADSIVRLHLLHVRPEILYVFNPYVDIVPLAPYVRAGIIAAGYAFTLDDGLDRRGVPPTGARMGWEVGLGALFMIDFMEPGAVKNAKASGMFNHAFLKFDVSYTDISGFGSPGFNLSPKDIIFKSGLPLLMTVGIQVELS